MQSCQRWSQCNTTAKYQTRLLFWNKCLVDNNTCSPLLKTADICYSTTHVNLHQVKMLPFFKHSKLQYFPLLIAFNHSDDTTTPIQTMFFQSYTLSFYFPQNPIFTVLMHANSPPQNFIHKYVHVVISVQSQWCPDWSNFMNWLLVKSTEWCIK